MIRFTKTSLVALASATAMTGTAFAGGFDRGGVNIDLLYSQERVAGEVSVTHVMPQRTINNVQRGSNEATNAAVATQLAPALVAAGITAPGALPTAEEIGAFVALNPAVNGALLLNTQTAVATGIAAGGGNPAPGFTNSIDVDGDYTVPRVGLKANLTDDLACLATYTEPFGADANYGLNNAYSASTVEFYIDTRDYGLTCAYRFTGPELGIGQSFFRIIGGISYQELEGFQSRQRFLDFANTGVPAGGVTNPTGLGTFDISGEAIGYRIGAAFEVPEIALRAELIYNSRYNYDDLSGIQDNTGFGTVFPNAQRVPITASAEIPQSVEVKLQSGIAPGTLAFLNIKWQEWSKLGIIPIEGGISPASGNPTQLSFDPLYQDGWTVTAGLGREFTDMVSGSAAVTWDRGTSTTSGTQTDTWTFAAGVAIEPNENVEFRVGGAVGILTSGSSIPPAGGDSANDVTYDFGQDTVTALSGSFRVKF